MRASRVVLAGTLAALLLSAGAVAAQGARGAAPPAPGSDIGPLEKNANPITPENPLPRRLSFVTPLYPSEAAGTGLALTITVKATLGDQGRVEEARVTGYRIDSPGTTLPATFADLRLLFSKSAVGAVRQWLYDSPANPPVSFYVQVRFVPDGESIIAWHDAALPPATPATVQASSPAIPGAIRVGGNVGPPKKIKDVKPVYPPLAASARVAGIVIIETTIGADGRVVDARVIRSIPLLDQAAIEAVRQWEFTPTLLNGAPTPIIMSVTVSFQPEQ